MEELATLGRAMPAFREVAPQVEDAGWPATAVVIVDRELRVLFANHAAHTLLNAGDGLCIRHGMLAAGLPGETEALQALTASLFDPEAAPWRGVCVHVARHSESRPYACVGQRLSGPAGSQVAVIFLTDPESEAAQDAATLKQRHELTTAESELAALLARGIALKAAAKYRGISYETARTQLKSLFQKTGCRKQGELVALLLRGRFK
jgi:DNA-binding CsgD family transcriptional regulator